MKKTHYRFFKRAAAVLLAAVMTFSLSACISIPGIIREITDSSDGQSSSSDPNATDKPGGSGGNGRNSGGQTPGGDTPGGPEIPQTGGNTIGTRADLTPAVDTSGMFSAFPQDIPQSAREWMPASEFQATYNEVAGRIRHLASAAGNDQALLDACNEIDDLYMNADAWYTFCYMAYQMEPERYRADSVAWDNALSQLYDDDWQIYHELLTGPYHDTVAGMMSTGMVDYYTNESTASGGQRTELRRQENDLINQYYDIAGTWNDYPTTRDYDMAIYNIYSQLVAVRQQIAGLYGYDNYAVYAYENNYGRDFTPDEVDAYYQNVVNYWVPAVDELDELMAQNGIASSGGPEFTEQEIYDLLHTMVSGLSSDYVRLEQYLEDQQLGFLDTHGDGGGVTVGLEYYDSACLYASGSDGLDVLGTLVHEFGHYANDCLAEDNYSSYDVQEIHSTGLQVLSTWFAGQTLGDYADDYAAQQIHFLMWYIGSQAATDKFEREVYNHYAETGQMYSYEELNQMYLTYFKECGEDTDATMWTEDSFLYDYPCYSLSYSISAATSLSMLAGMEQDFEGTVSNYMRLVAQTDVAGYVAAVEQSGMPNVLDPQVSSQTAEAVISYCRDFFAQTGGNGEPIAAEGGSEGAGEGNQPVDIPVPTSPAVDANGNTVDK
ncbi:MAG: hypothetical protein II772_04355 [Lachnospiraceae bacterium]|nr:hypothetical protein [Lachnospiraceae bacterium]